MAARWAGIDSEISIHALREEGDAIPPQATGGILIFLSTPSARRATRREDDESRRDKISIHALREEGDGAVGTAALRRGISIHALREEGDRFRLGQSSPCSYFYPRPPRGGRLWIALKISLELLISIHALREEGDVTTVNYPRIIEKFLSTPSARRATSGWRPRPPWRCNFYPRPPRGGRPEVCGADRRICGISIHALREEGDFCNTFQLDTTENISIHALREEGDQGVLAVLLGGDYFYPRPPRGGRQQKQRQNLYFLINYTTFCTNLEEL